MSLKSKLRKAGKTEKLVNFNNIDHSFLVIVFMLLAFGLIMVFSASSASAHYIQGDATYFFKKQLIWAILGVIAMCAIATVPRATILKYTGAIFVGSIVLLLLVPIIGVSANGAKRWLGVGGFTFQPSEIVKFTLVLFLAKTISQNPKTIKKLGGFMGYIVLVGIVSGIVLLEPHMSGAVIIFMVGCAVLFFSGYKIRYFVTMGLMALPAVGAAAILSPYRLKRVMSFLDPFKDKMGDSWQIVQSLYAIGSGGLFGLGLGQSRQKFLYIPEPQNDFIYAIVCEELGFVGAVLLILLFALFIWRGIVIARKAPDTFSSLAVAGIISVVALQTIFNIAVVTSTVPVTGVPLPFFSYGGSSLFFLLIAMGFVLNVSRDIEK